MTLVGEAAPEPPGRTIALFDGSVRLLAELGVWDGLAPKAAPLRKLRIIDDTDNLFRWPELCFEASEIGLDAFGWNVEAEELSNALRRSSFRHASNPPHRGARERRSLRRSDERGISPASRSAMNASKPR